MYIVQCTLYIYTICEYYTQCTIEIKHRTQYIIYNVHCSLYNIQYYILYTLHRMQSTQCSVLCDLRTTYADHTRRTWLSLDLIFDWSYKMWLYWNVLFNYGHLTSLDPRWHHLTPVDLAWPVTMLIKFSYDSSQCHCACHVNMLSWHAQNCSTP